MDQYDNPCAHYSLVLRDGRVIGGARVMPTTASLGAAHLHAARRPARKPRLDSARRGAGRLSPSKEIWECTRLVISDRVSPAKTGRTACSLIVEGLVEIAARLGGQELVTLTRPALVRALRQLGFAANRIGEPYRSADGRDYAVLHMPAMASSHRMAAE